MLKARYTNVVGLLGLLTASAAQPAVNPSFEELDANGRPAGWAAVAWGAAGLVAEETCTVVTDPDAPEGRRVARIALSKPQFAAFGQRLAGLVPGQWYEASAMVRCEGLRGQGCHLNIEFWEHGQPVGKGEAGSPASPSPLSQWGQFPIFTGVTLSVTGRPQRDCPLRGASPRSLTV